MVLGEITPGIVQEYRIHRREKAMAENGKPAARGLEFGTTGLHQPFPVLVKKGTILGRPLYAFLDAGESQTRSYWMFLTRVTASFSGASNVTRNGSNISVQ